MGTQLGSFAYMLPVATEPNIYTGLQESAGLRDSTGCSANNSFSRSSCLRKGPKTLRWGLDREMHAAQDRPCSALPARQAAALPAPL